MGNSVLGGSLSAMSGDSPITKFYSSAAWVEGRAEHQLDEVAKWTGIQKIAAFPDLHPGKFGPVGCAVLADRLFPQLIGNDIGCGMALFELDLPARKFKVDKALRRFRSLGETDERCHADALDEIGLPADLFPSSLGTVGGGNHFCEVQTVATAEAQSGLDASRLYLLVHSGSRGVGTAVLNALPEGAFAGLAADGEAGQTYLAAHDQAVAWARLNRTLLAERAAAALRTQARLIADVPHNLLEMFGTGWLHRKGAARADGQVPVAGSRATPSFLVEPLHHADALASLAHGSGRRYDRSSMHGRVRAKRSDLEAMQRTQYGGRIICEDRDLLVEEAPLAYKASGAVVADLETSGAARKVAELHPLLTFKKTKREKR